jgi:hypothetical protein
MLYVAGVAFGPWTWGGNGKTYEAAAEVAFQQTFFVDGVPTEELPSTEHLVLQDGIWRWFLGADPAFLAGLPASCASVQALPTYGERRSAPALAAGDRQRCRVAEIGPRSASRSAFPIERQQTRQHRLLCHRSRLRVLPPVGGLHRPVEVGVP